MKASTRGRFLVSVGAAACAPALVAAGSAEIAPQVEAPAASSYALVLSGGGARGAYEAGIVTKLASIAGIADGETLLPYRLVCGTSIGALNAWFTATGQYGALKTCWSTIAGERIIRLKRRYASLSDASAGVGTRFMAAVRLVTALTKHERAVAETSPVLDWIARHVDPALPLLMPMVWAVTNVTTQSAEYFYRLPPTAARGPASQAQIDAMRVTLGPSAVIREASDEMLHRSLLASAAMPVLFDPVFMAFDGTGGYYVDGGVASNVSVALARTVASHVHVVLAHPPQSATAAGNAVEIVLAAYATMQRKIVESEMRDAYFTSLAKREIERLAPDAAKRLQTLSVPMGAVVANIPVTTVSYVRPQTVLPADVASFDRQDHLNQTFAIGEADAVRGFTPYDWETFRL